MERMMRIHALLQKNEYPNCTTLAKEFELCIRTVVRDLDFMRDRLQLRELTVDELLLNRPCGGGNRLLRQRRPLFTLVLLRKANQPRCFPLLEKLLASARLQVAGRTDPPPMLAKRERQLTAAQPATHPNHVLRVFQLRLPGLPPARGQNALDSVHHEPPLS